MNRLHFALVGVGLSWAVSAATWTIYHEGHVPVKDGVAVAGAGTMTGVEQLTNALTQAVNGDTIIIKPGVYDLSVLEPMKVASFAYCYLCARDANGAVRQTKLVLKGECEKSWRDRSPEEETVLLGDDRATIFYAHGGGGRPTSIYNLVFEHGRRVSMSGIGDLGGGAISWAATEQFSLQNRTSLASNCVFRSCSSDGKGGGTYGLHVFDSFYTNCTAGAAGGGAYGFWNNNSGTKNTTNTFDRCVFVDCSAPNGGAIYAREMTSLSGCSFAGCRATDGNGGAVYVNGNLERVQDCTFTNCTTSGDAGGLQVVGNLDCLPNCTFTACASTSRNGGNGGAVNTRNGAKTDILGTVVDCTFSDCEGGWAGGAVFSDDIGAIENCTFLSNRVRKASGGAVYSAKNIASISNTMFVGNAARESSGGAIYAATSLGTITGSRFSDNAAASSWEGGGGIFTGTLSGVYSGCAFHSNTNNETTYGAHVNKALKMVDCSFSGYGDVVAKSYDRCVFSNCVYQYTERNYGADHHGLVSFTDVIGDGTFRNCLVRNCLASRIIASGGVRADVANCTFVDNTVDDAPPAGKPTNAIMFYAFRSSDGKVASTNVMVNCIFADNRVRGQKAGEACDLYCSGSVSPRGHSVVRNCLYKNADSVAWGNGTHESSNLDHGDPKFVAGNAQFPNAPYYMPRLSSDAR